MTKPDDLAFPRQADAAGPGAGGLQNGELFAIHILSGVTEVGAPHRQLVDIAVVPAHEKLCKKNPTNDRPCFHCPHLTQEETQAFTETLGEWGDELQMKITALYCASKQIFLHTPQNAIKQNWYALVDNDNEPMPQQCDIYDQEQLI